ncbi:MAG TPA: anaerobic ribonucleoside-triphosphate reductase activating protein [Peptococcaceae bacterium]|nr:MAG: Anaerobic ribonucleoside-triphosphate reductase-activating protein [Clostridia bacterium 41_269]HBT20097.1 anaerobic ribonucleoside-triphosphate reductase activating protein [Peptococcaceae bacterium]
MKIRLAGIERESVVDGPGIRFVIFGQGCPHRCPGCHNKHTWDPKGGYLMDADEIIKEVLQSRIVRGVTFSGGEPFYQASAFSYIGREVKKHGFDVVTYSGYVFEDLLELAESREGFWELLYCTDYLIDGPFILAQKDLSLPFRGSRNQRIIDVKKSLEKGRAVLMSDWDILVV